jgi:hypothetical protein
LPTATGKIAQKCLKWVNVVKVDGSHVRMKKSGKFSIFEEILVCKKFRATNHFYTQKKKLFRNSSAADDIHLREMI